MPQTIVESESRGTTQPTKPRIIRVEEVLKCPECGSGRLNRDYVRGECVCAACGLVIDDYTVDLGAEWHAEADDAAKRARTGGRATLAVHDKGLSTEISWTDRDSFGKRVPARNRALVYRMRKWQHRMRTANANERTLAKSLPDLDRLASEMGLPRNVRETAAVTFRKCLARHLMRGRRLASVVAAALYSACRQHLLPRTLDEISNAARLPRKEIGRTYRLMVRELRLRSMPVRPDEYVARFVSDLKLSMEVQTRTLSILKDAHQRELTSGRGPTGLAAAALYISTILCDERRTQREVADEAGVTEVTIRNRYKELAEKLDIRVQL